MKDICYWSVGDDEFGYMLQSLVSSYRQVGMTEDFLAFSDREIEGASTQLVKDFDKSFYLFKFSFLQYLKQFPYRYFVFIDADSYFVRKVGSLLPLMKNSPIHSFLESDLTVPSIRQEWHRCSLPKMVQLMQECGITNSHIYNVNAGFFIVQRDAIDVVCQLAIDFWKHGFANGFAFTEEPSLAYVTQMLCGNVADHLLKNNRTVWGTDWTGHYRHHLPDGKEWLFKDYFTEETYMINPAIVHVLKGKEMLITHGKSLFKHAA